MMKNRILLLLAFLLCMGQIIGCSQTEPTKINADEAADQDRVSIVCTTFPSYDWTRELLKDCKEEAELTLLVDNGVDLHSYQPTAEDIIKIGNADVLIYVGGESDGWISEALPKNKNKETIVINLLEELGEGAKIEEMVEGMQEDDHEHEMENEEEHIGEDEEEPGEHTENHQEEYDEHIWLSLKNAAVLVGRISDALQSVSPENSQQVEKNEAAYIEKLEELDRRYEQVVAESSFNTLVFGDRFPFRYLTDDYQLNYYAAFSGCSAETEASFDTIAFLSKKVDEINTPSIMVIESSDQKIAETVKQNTKEKNQRILVINSIQSVTREDINSGFTYIQAMEDNLAVLNQALN